MLTVRKLVLPKSQIYHNGLVLVGVSYTRVRKENSSVANYTEGLQLIPLSSYAEAHTRHLCVWTVVSSFRVQP